MTDSGPLSDIHARNAEVVTTLIRRRFARQHPRYVAHLEARLRHALTAALLRPDLQLNPVSDVFSFGSTKRGTYVPDYLDFDFSVDLDSCSSKRLSADPAAQTRLRNLLIAELNQQGFAVHHVTEHGLVKNGTLYIISMRGIRDLRKGISFRNVDFTFCVAQTANIGPFNHEVLAQTTAMLKRNYGHSFWVHLTSQIRFTKWVLKKPHLVKDATGWEVRPMRSTIICAKYGLVSVLVEYSLLSLAVRGPKLGSFDEFMRSIYAANRAFQSQPGNRRLLMDVQHALTHPKTAQLIKVGFTEWTEKGGKAPPDFGCVHSDRTLEGFKDLDKWNTFVKLAVDYFEEPQFFARYISLKGFTAAQLAPNVDSVGCKTIETSGNHRA